MLFEVATCMCAEVEFLALCIFLDPYPQPWADLRLHV